MGPAATARVAPSRARSRLRKLFHPSEKVHEAQSPHQPGRLPDDPAAHLRDPCAAVHEHDRDLADAKPPFPDLKGYLNLEGVAVRLHLVQADALQGPAAETLEAPGGVVDRQAGD